MRLASKSNIFYPLFLLSRWRMCFISLCFLPGAATVFAQLPASPENHEVYDLYMQSVGSSARIFTGATYTTKYPTVKGSPFFLEATTKTGNISFGGVLYYEVPLRFDLVTQQVIVSSATQKDVILPSEKIDSFEIAGHVFLRLQPDSITNAGIKYGFYERLHKGLFVFRSRVVHKALRAEDLSYFDVYDTYFLQKNQVYHQFAGERGLRKLLGISKQQMDKNGLSWKKDPENAMRAAVETFDLSTSL